MNKRVTSIIEEARKLSLAEREELFLRLRAEFEDEGSDGTPEEIEAAWVEEVERRIDRAERGETTFVPAEEVHARLRERLKRL
ncbi:MAG: addiction module protein [Hyphomicrobiaceae bacterium]